jgi:hypothetical protein
MNDVITYTTSVMSNVRYTHHPMVVVTRANKYNNDDDDMFLMTDHTQQQYYTNNCEACYSAIKVMCGSGASGRFLSYYCTPCVAVAVHYCTYYLACSVTSKQLSNTTWRLRDVTQFLSGHVSVCNGRKTSVREAAINGNNREVT